jgi:hypothetical protein
LGYILFEYILAVQSLIGSMLVQCRVRIHVCQLRVTVDYGFFAAYFNSCCVGFAPFKSAAVQSSAHGIGLVVEVHFGCSIYSWINVRVIESSGLV